MLDPDGVDDRGRQVIVGRLQNFRRAVDRRQEAAVLDGLVRHRRARQALEVGRLVDQAIDFGVEHQPFGIIQEEDGAPFMAGVSGNPMALLSACRYPDKVRDGVSWAACSCTSA